MNLYEDKEFLQQKYWVEGLTAKQIAKICSCNPTVIFYQMIKLNIPRRTTSEVRKGKYMGEESHLWKGDEATHFSTYNKRARRIWENYYGVKIPKDCAIHHRDFNFKNNQIWNLGLLRKKTHDKIHTQYRKFLKKIEKLEQKENK